MKALLGKIFGSGDVIKAGFELIDDMHTSDAEEMEEKRKNEAQKVKSKTELLGAYSAFKVAQRVIAIMFVTVYLVSFILCLGMALYNGATIKDIKGLLADFWIGEIVFTIVLFYFGGGAFEGGANVLKRKVKV